MLDPHDPELEKIFRISGCCEAVLWLARRMTLVGTVARAELMAEAEAPMGELRRLTGEYWPADETKLAAVEALHAGLRTLATTPSENDFLIHWSKKTCTVCGGRIQDPARQPELVCCPNCLTVMDSGRDAMTKAFFTAEDGSALLE